MASSIENALTGGALKGSEAGANTLAGGEQSYLNMLEPWIQAGLDPQAYYQKLMQGYTESPQAKQQIQAGINAANAAGAASGLAGSGAEQTALQKQGQDIVAGDQQNWLNNLLGISDTGLKATENYGDISSQLQKELAKYNLSTQEAKTSGKNSAIKSGLGFLGNL